MLQRHLTGFKVTVARRFAKNEHSTTKLNWLPTVSELNCRVQLCGRAPSESRKVTELNAVRVTAQLTRAEAAHWCHLVRFPTAPSKWSGLTTWHLQRAHDSVQRSVSLARCWARTTPRPARQSLCESNTLWLGSSGALKSASMDREVQPERALSQSFVERLRIFKPSGRCGTCWMQSVKWSECWMWTSERGSLTEPVFRIGVEHL